MAKTVVGLFEQDSDADATVRDLENAGVPRTAISLARRGEAQLDARLMDAGIPQRDASLFADGVQQGNTLVVVQGVADDDAEEAAMIMDRHNVVDLGRRQPNYQRMSLERTTARAGAGPVNTNLYEGNELAVPIIEEELHVGKRAVERGGVRVRTRVEEVPVNEQVTLRDEEVRVERRRVDRPVSEADLASIQEGTFEVRETDEEAVVDKQARVVEEVVVKKDVAERTETVQDTVRRTDVDIQDVAGQTTTGGTVDVDTTSASSDEGTIERGASKLGNAVERATGADIDRDGDVGRRDPRNNV